MVLVFWGFSDLGLLQYLGDLRLGLGLDNNTLKSPEISTMHKTVFGWGERLQQSHAEASLFFSRDPDYMSEFPHHILCNDSKEKWPLMSDL